MNASTDAQVAQFLASELKENTLRPKPDGIWVVDLSGLKDFNDLAIFQGSRVSQWTLKGTAVTDL